jgi:hypothetical protein
MRLCSGSFGRYHLKKIPISPGMPPGKSSTSARIL